MKKYFFIFFTVTSTLSFGQNLKFGFVYEDYIIANLNETKALQADINTKKQAFESKLEAQAKNYQEKYTAYQEMMKDVTKLSSDALNNSLKEVQGLQKIYNDTQAEADSSLQSYAQLKFLEIQNKVRKATKTVADEKGYKYIIRKNIEPDRGETNTFLLYSANEKQDDLTDIVLAKLGTVPPKK